MSFSRACITALFASLLLITVTALAKDGRDFAGFYKVSHAKIQGDHVLVTLNLQVNDVGVAELSHAVVALRQNAGLQVVGTSKLIGPMHLHDHVNLSQQFTVSRHEYDSWQTGGKPDFSIIYRANGKTLEQSFQVSRRDF
jgi:hypothetical protein